MCKDSRVEAPGGRNLDQGYERLQNFQDKIAADVQQTRAPERNYSEQEIVAELFRYHPPTVDSLPKYTAIRQAAKNFAEVLLENCPRCADRTSALRKIREAAMTANQAVACNGLGL